MEMGMHQQPLIKGPASEICLKHNETNVGFNEKTKEIFCNTCIFERKVNELKFTAIVVKEIKDRFTKEFQKYKESMNQMGDADPQLVKNQIRTSVTEFFVDLKSKVQQMQKNVMQKIQNTESLRNLEKVLEGSKEFLHLDQNQKPDHFEREKKIFDEKINKGRFAYVVKRKEFYKNLIESLDKSRIKMKETID